jgi:primosomal protein N'
MYYYQILLTINSQQPILTYQSEKQIIVNTLVQVIVRKKLYYGIILRQITKDEIDFDISLIKNIESIYNYKLPSQSLRFINLFSFYTFNYAGIVLESILKSLNYLNKKDLQQLLNYNARSYEKDDKIEQNQQEAVKNDKIKYEQLENQDYSSRIIYIIRTLLNQKLSSNNKKITPENINLLIICPEKKMLNLVLEEVEQIDKKNIQIFTYTGERNKSSLITYKYFSTENQNNNIISSSKDKVTLNVIFATRSGLFIPFCHLDHVILLDEANSYYVQEQNSLYYDAREALYFLQKAYQCNILFLSNLFSIRLHNFISKASKTNIMINKSELNNNRLRIKITGQNAKIVQKDQIFSPEIDLILQNDDIDIDYD